MQHSINVLRAPLELPGRLQAQLSNPAASTRSIQVDALKALDPATLDSDPDLIQYVGE